MSRIVPLRPDERTLAEVLKRAAGSRIPAEVIEAVNERRAGSCEATGWPTLHVQYHHRRAYGMGGRQDDDPDQNTEHNILGLCRRHHDWAHAHPRQARERGFIVPSWQDPADVPVLPDHRLGRC